MGFNDLKKKRKNSLDKLREAATKENQGGGNSYQDDRFWQPTVDKAGNGSAVIRFLPAPDGEDMPWARVWSHGFKGPKGWFIENCPTSINRDDCPVCKLNSETWDDNDEDAKNVVRNRKRKLSYISNIYVVNDPANSENNGKVFLFRYGKKIFEKVNAMMNPEDPDDTPVDPFDFWDGANFKLSITKVAGFRNYDNSKFKAPSALSDDNSELESVYNSLHSLTQFLAEDQFKSHDELKSRLDKVMGVPGRGVAERNEPKAENEKQAEAPAPQPKAKAAAEPAADTESSPWDDDDDDGDDAKSFFNQLAEDDDEN